MSNLEKYNHYMSAARDFQGGPFAPKDRYIICSSPRTGSTLLGQMLYETRAAGDPLEYFNPFYFPALMARAGVGSDLGLLLSFLEKHRTTPNGAFGLQIHWSHFIAAFGKDDLLRDKFFDRHEKIIFIRRRDKIGQAFSYYRASNSKIWSSIDEDIKKSRYFSQNEKLDPLVVSKCIVEMILQDQGWVNYLTGRKKTYLTIYYEDLIEDWENQSLKVLNYIQPYSGKVPPMALRQQRPEQDLASRDFRQYLGI